MSQTPTDPKDMRAERAAAFIAEITPLMAFDEYASVDGLQGTMERYVDGDFSQVHFDEMTARILRNYAPMSEEEVADEVASRRRPALMVNLMPMPDVPGAPGCWVGGLPNLPPEMAWPMADLYGNDKVPLHFIAQIDLAQVPRLPGMPDMPKSGTLFFFFMQLWYYDFEGDHEMCCRVLYSPDAADTHPPRDMPQMPDLSQFEVDWEFLEAYEERGATTGPFRQWNFDFHPFEDVSAFGVEHRRLDLAITQENNQTLEALQARADERLRPFAESVEDGDFYAPVQQFLGSHYQLNTGSPFHLLSMEPSMTIGFFDEIESIDFAFEDQEAYDAFDVSRVTIRVVVS